MTYDFHMIFSAVDLRSLPSTSSTDIVDPCQCPRAQKCPKLLVIEFLYTTTTIRPKYTIVINLCY